MEQLLQTIIEPLVDFPEDIQISKEDHHSSVTYHISVNKEDTGKVIGKQGRLIKAIRTLTMAGQHESGKKVFVEID
ncbi:KH domain-containing protein [Macrococcus bovicus]|uniref:RNA-binding protein KhpA n=1 Tax=Macrococcus bovicus TaxID=69968 RepID=A0A4R6BZK8_9STAP|nr:KH domain-containing protein [Macrococcus bovicus]TDM13819.1 KH domain-containing protein [Macrococcus bovicus]WJP98662.1 KH domain-containing protein [Macrococcus bovicus]